MNTQLQLGRIIRQSADVMLHPSVRTFNYYAARASDSDALTYVAIGALLQTVLSLLAGGGGSAMNLVISVVNQLFQFYLFAGLVYFFGKQFAGIGNFESVTYAFALFYVPILVLSWLLIWVMFLLQLYSWLLIPLILQVLAQGIYAYQAIQAVLYIRRKRDAALSVVIGMIMLWVVQMALSRLSTIGL